ncbi:hypothetical protein GDO81_014330 [Engystomops pustulosus]|uniref:Interleukin-18 n=1 Tax=Engystomops pustulosus TaxID=76066 RepID=A0AAV7B9M1_ENGPU|nr:hypothetical protein GDO81_014330 [Engystomops pustulosus]KAG8569269.1 hypothetical protein GDO81_014330 [Engystomops pustulosus]
MTAADIDFDVLKVDEGILVFEDNPEIVDDSWKKSDRMITGILENIFKLWLKVHPDDPDGAVFTNPAPDCTKFNLLLYRTNSISEGLSIAFTVKYENETYYMCCTEDMKLYFKKGECPSLIKGDHSDIIFFQKQFSAGDSSFRFQSSLNTDYYLAVSDKSGKPKLVLQKYNGFSEMERFNVV